MVKEGIMASCVTCGGSVPPETQVCGGCRQRAMVAVPVPRSPEPLFSVRYATGHFAGPYTESIIKIFIAQQQLQITDAVSEEGSGIWLPIVQSKFAPQAPQRTTLESLDSSPCPSCGAGMVAATKRSKLGLALVLIGIALAPAFGAGIPIFVVGFILRRGEKGRAAYQCPRCNFSRQ